MHSLTVFFNNLTTGKKVLIALSPIITLIISMKAALIGLSILILLDLISGIYKTQHEWGIIPNPFSILFWKSIKSYLLRNTWRKAYEYGMGIIVVVIFESLVLGQSSVSLLNKNFSLSELAVIIPSIIEVWSIFENLEAVSKNNFLKRLITLLPPKIQALFTGNKLKHEHIQNEE